MRLVWPPLALLVAALTASACAEESAANRDDDEQMVGASKMNIEGPEGRSIEQAPAPSSNDPTESSD